MQNRLRSRGAALLGGACVAAALVLGSACEMPDPEGLARDRPTMPSPPGSPPGVPPGPPPGPFSALPSNTEALGGETTLVAPTAADRPKPGAASWNPATTRAVIVGVLTFADPKITTFSARNRKDQELADTLIARGVPRGNVTVLLDGAATTSAVLAALEKQARAASPGSTLLFYYAGHGTKAESGDVSFLAFDASKDAQLAVATVGRIIRGAFRGSDVLLLADCCHSGALIDLARGLGQGAFRATAITSAESSNTSTGNWTYTQATIDAFRGEPLADRDRDGRVELAEWATEVRDAMKFRERQRAGIALGGIPASFELGAASGSAPAPAKDAPAIGSYVAAPRNGKPDVARVVARSAGSATLAFYDYSDFSRAESATSALTPVRFERHAPGAKLKVTWGGKVWDADVVRTEDDFHLITYPGWSSWWDEWIASDRIVGTR